MQQVESLLTTHGLIFENQFDVAIRSLIHTESSKSMLPRLASLLPQPVLLSLRFLSPTHIYLFGKSPRWSKDV